MAYRLIVVLIFVNKLEIVQSSVIMLRKARFVHFPLQFRERL